MTTTNTGYMAANHSGYVSKSDNAGRAREILEKKIETGRQSAIALFERVNKEAPVDALVRGHGITFAPLESVNGRPAEVRMGFKGAELQLHKHALGQLAARAEIPSKYLGDQAAAGGWRSELAAEILNKHYRQGEGATRFLVRQVDGVARGVLSDKYRRLDCRPLIDAFAAKCQKVGAVPVDGTASDTRVALKAIVPVVFEPVAGEVLAFGVEWSNSDYGHGMHAIRAFMLRLWCLNGATMENALGQVHLGAKLSDDIELSARTMRLDTETSMSALGDVVNSLLAPKKLEALCEGIRQADEKKIEWKTVSTKLAKRLLKSELDSARALFEGDDVVNLPAGKSVWRASNALSWLAGQSTDADRKLDLQRLAGEVIHGGKAEVEQIAA